MRLGGVPALVLSATGDALKVVVPRVGPGEPARALEVRVPGSTSVGQGTLQVAAPADPVEFRFVAEPFTAVPGRGHAVLSTGLGPAFVLAASGGKSAAARAVEAAERLNDAAQALRTTVGLNLEARGLDASPVLGLAGQPEALLEVTEEDAAAYNEDWTGLRGRGGPVTRARLARWWEALGRDIVLLTVRGEKPRFAAALAPEGRVLVQLFEAAQRTGRPGVPRQVVDEARPPLRDGLRLLALRVPASVTAPVRRGRRGALRRCPPPPRRPPPARCSSRGPGPAARWSRASASTSASRSGGAAGASPTRAASPSPCRSSPSSSPAATRCASASRSAAASATTRGSGTARRSPARSRRTRRDATSSRPSSCAGARQRARQPSRRSPFRSFSRCSGVRSACSSAARRPAAFGGARPVAAAGQQLRVRLPHQVARVVAAHAGARVVAVARAGRAVEVRAAEDEDAARRASVDTSSKPFTRRCQARKSRRSGRHRPDGRPDRDRRRLAAGRPSGGRRRASAHGRSPLARRSARWTARSAAEAESATRFTTRRKTPSRMDNSS